MNQKVASISFILSLYLHLLINLWKRKLKQEKQFFLLYSLQTVECDQEELMEFGKRGH